MGHIHYISRHIDFKTAPIRPHAQNRQNLGHPHWIHSSSIPSALRKGPAHETSSDGPD